MQTVAWEFCSTVSTATYVSPGQLAFNYNMIMQAVTTVDGEIVKSRRKGLSFVNNSKEIKKGVARKYSIGTIIIIVLGRKYQGPNLSSPIEGPYVILKICSNGTVNV